MTLGNKELENRGHYFVRYADDFSIYVKKSENKRKNKTVLLGHTVLKNCNSVIAKKTYQNLKRQ